MSSRVNDYYNETAGEYDLLHGGDKNLEHIRALERSWPMLSRLGVRSVVDVGCGTGRSMRWLASRDPSLTLVGVDPSSGLLDIAREHLWEARLEVGRGEELPLDDASVDLAIATGIMHHVENPSDVISEMFRVARKAVLISDHNNFAFGGKRARQLRLWLYASGLLPAATFIKQGFRKQGYSKEDGWWFPYSLLDSFSIIANLSAEQYIIPTTPAYTSGENLLLAQSHLAIIGVK